MGKFTRLLSPGKIGKMELKNRFVVPPMGTNYANADGTVSEKLEDYLIERAKGGFGLIITEIAAVDPVGKAIVQQAGIWDDKFIPGWRALIDKIHKYGAKVAIQLHHAGRQTRSSINGAQVVAPSCLPCPVCNEIPHELTIEEIEDLINKFAEGARRAQEAGADAIEIHGAHGYLIAQFLSAYSNRLTSPISRRITLAPTRVVHRKGIG